MTLAQAYENLSSKGFIKPLDPTPMPNPIPPTWNFNEYCHFHKKFGNKTDNYFRLKHEIQDLIDNGTLPNPNITTKPNNRKKLFPDVNTIFCLPSICVPTSKNPKISFSLHGAMRTSRMTWCNPFEHRSTQSAFLSQNDQNARS